MRRKISYKAGRSSAGEPTHQSGFTLIEIIVASAIASIIMLMLYSSYRSTLTSIKRTTGQAEFYENLNLAITKIDMDISNTYYNKNNKNICFICEPEGENSRLSFVTVNYSEFNLGGNIKKPNPKADINEVGYYLRTDRDTQGLYFLIKREDFHFDDEPESGGSENILLENVVSLKFEFDQRNDWTERWDTRNNNRFPKAVKTILTLKNYQGKEERFEFISLVNIKRRF